MHTKDYNFTLQDCHIANFPKRDKSKLLVVDRTTDSFYALKFVELDKILNKGDCVVLNDSFVFPARLYGSSISKDKEYEFLLITEQEDKLTWKVLIKGSRGCNVGDEFIFSSNLKGILNSKLEGGINYISFNQRLSYSMLDKLGQMAVPKYILDLRGYDDKDKLAYQTIYNKKSLNLGVQGSIAAPTAGLHFTDKVLNKLKEKGVEIAFLTLNISLGTFKPIISQTIEEHKMDSEEYILNKSEADKINLAIKNKKKILAVGTTTTRVLEHCASLGKLRENKGKTNLFIYPGYKFKVVNAIITNLHMPKSTPLLLVSAFAGHKLIKASYDYAILNDFAFYSYGDAMIII